VYNPQSPQSKSILITGCSSGIGYQAATKLHQLGYTVVASARNPDDVTKLKSEGLHCVRLDLNCPQSIQNAVRETLQITQGRLYALFNNGAYGQTGAVEDLSRTAIQEQFETNVFGWMELTNLVLPVMRQQGNGRIIQNSSVLGLVALKFRGAYTASKYAIEGFSDTLRLELRGTDIHVCLIEPGPIESKFRQNSYVAFQRHIDMTRSTFSEDYKQQVTRLTKHGHAVPFTLPADAVVAKVIHCLEAKNPSARYYVTVPTYLFAYLRRFLSTRMLDRILSRI